MRPRLLLIFWLIADVLLFVAAYALAYFLRVGWILSSDFPFRPYIATAMLVAPLWLLVLLTTRTFAFTRKQVSVRNAAYIVYAAVVGTSLFALAYYFLHGEFFSRKLLVYALLLSAIVPFGWHALYEQLFRSILRRDPPAFPTLIIGVTRESKALIELMNRKRNPLKPVAILDAMGAKETDIDGVPVLGKLNKLEEILDRYRITHLIQCSDLEQSINLLSACRNRRIHYAILPSVLGIVQRDERIESIEGHGMVVVSPNTSPLSWFTR